MPKKSYELNLLYRASQNGWDDEDFHKLCDNLGATLMICYAEGRIFGGYNPLFWSNNQIIYL